MKKTILIAVAVALVLTTVLGLGLVLYDQLYLNPPASALSNILDAMQTEGLEVLYHYSTPCAHDYLKALVMAVDNDVINWLREMMKMDDFVTEWNDSLKNVDFEIQGVLRQGEKAFVTVQCTFQDGNHVLIDVVMFCEENTWLVGNITLPYVEVE